MNKLQNDFKKLLNEKLNEDIKTPEFTKEIASKLLNHINNIQLYAHSYAFTLHFEHCFYTPKDLLNFAHQNGLKGIDIHIDSGKEKSLEKMSDFELKELRDYAEKLNLKIMLEISSTFKSDVNKVIKIANILDVQNIRLYNRHAGYLLESIGKCIDDLKYACKAAEKNDLYFVLEPHEDLKSDELIQIIKEVDSPGLGILFDFGNMINANEKPLESLKTLSSYIQHVHIKDVKVIPVGSGFAHLGITDGQGDLPQMRMLYELLMLGDEDPQVKIFALEQVNGYYAPPFRFSDEAKNPKIPNREPSITRDNPEFSSNENLHIEKENAIHQVRFIKRLLNDLKIISERCLDSE